MKILFTICGRAGSKGIKNKNIKDFLGIPLPFYTYSAIDLYMKQNPEHPCDIVLNTDSVDLIQLFRQAFGDRVDVIQRDPALGQDNTSKVAVIQNCLAVMEQRKAVSYDMVVDLDITSPLRTVEDVTNLINKKAQTQADVVFSVTESRRNPYFNMVKKGANGYERVIASSFNARQEAPEIFDMNASLYAYSPAFLVSGKGIFEGQCDIIKMLDTAVLDLDHEGDFDLMEIIASHLFAKNPAFREVRDHIIALTTN
jgi:CMP-N,N'-diacetyllegionaminic acid synthase